MTGGSDVPPAPVTGTDGKGETRVSPYDPWRHLAQLSDVMLESHSGGDAGWIKFSTRTISLRSGMSAIEQRCTLTHELVHLERGPYRVTEKAVEERLVELAAAARLVSREALDAGLDVLAASLRVDPNMLGAAFAVHRPAELVRLVEVARYGSDSA